MCDVRRLDMEYLAYGYGLLDVRVTSVECVGMESLACGYRVFNARVWSV